MLRKLFLTTRKISLTFRKGVSNMDWEIPSIKDVNNPCAMNKLNFYQVDQYLKQTFLRVTLIDVREKKELEETGTLPKSVHIPLAEVESALQFSTSKIDFKDKYGAEKPDMTDRLIFSCRSGNRSCTALKTALKLGYINVSHYGGGWLDYEKHMKMLEDAAK